MTVGHFAKMFDPGKNGLQLTDDFVMRLKDECSPNDPNVIFLVRSMERLVEVCSLEMYCVHKVNLNDKVVIIADTRHTQRWSEREIDSIPCCASDIGMFASLWAHERTLGIPRNEEDLETVEFADVLGAAAEDQHLTRCAQVCFTGTEEHQAERHDQGMIDEVLRHQGMEVGGGVLDEARSRTSNTLSDTTST